MGYPSFFKKISITLDINVYLENLKKIFSDIWMLALWKMALWKQQKLSLTFIEICALPKKPPPTHFQLSLTYPERAVAILLLLCGF